MQTRASLVGGSRRALFLPQPGQGARPGRLWCLPPPCSLLHPIHGTSPTRQRLPISRAANVHEASGALAFCQAPCCVRYEAEYNPGVQLRRRKPASQAHDICFSRELDLRLGSASPTSRNLPLRGRILLPLPSAIPAVPC